MARRPLTPTESRDIADTLHRLVLMELVEAGNWSCKNMAFQGGTSLHLVWGSPRYSEDLDFLVAKSSENDLMPSMNKVKRKVQSWMSGKYPQCKIEVKDRRKPDNNVKKFDVVWSEPSILGTVMVRAEFYSIDQALVESYKPLLEQVDSEKIVRLHATIPAAQREVIFHDKMHAIADRPYLKWRDLFDVWWLRTQSKGSEGRGLTPPWEDDKFWERARVVNAMYGTLPEGLEPGLQKFLSLPKEEVVAAAEKDLQPFLPPKLWERLKKDGMIEVIVDFVRNDIQNVLKTIAAGPENFQSKSQGDEFDIQY